MDYEETRLTEGDFSIYASTVDGNAIVSKTSSLEVQLTSTYETDFEWVAGIYLFNEELDNTFLNQVINPLVDNVPDLTADFTPQWQPWLNQIRLDTVSTAAYFQGNYTITEDTRAIAGIRYTNDEREWDIYGQNPNDLSTLNFNVLEVDNAKGDWSKVTWKLGLEHDLSDDELLYVKISCP